MGGDSSRLYVLCHTECPSGRKRRRSRSRWRRQRNEAVTSVLSRDQRGLAANTLLSRLAIDPRCRRRFRRSFSSGADLLARTVCGRHEFRFPLAPRTPLLHPSLPVSQCRPLPPLPPSRARFIRCLLSAATSSPRARSAAAAALFGVPAAFARPTLRSRGARGRKGGSREAAAGRREEYRCRCMHIDGSNDDVRAASTANT